MAQETMNLEIIHDILNKDYFLISDIFIYGNKAYKVPKTVKMVTFKRSLLLVSVAVFAILIIGLWGKLVYPISYATLFFFFLFYFIKDIGFHLFGFQLDINDLEEYSLKDSDKHLLKEMDLEKQFKEVYATSRNYIYYNHEYYRIPEEVKRDRTKRKHVMYLIILLLFVLLSIARDDFLLQIVIILGMLFVTFIIAQFKPSKIKSMSIENLDKYEPSEIFAVDKKEK